MSIQQQLNQFTQSAFKGDIAMGTNPMSCPAQVYISSGNTLRAGDVVTLVDSTSKAISIDLAAASDVPFGVVIRNPKKTTFTAGDAIEIAMDGSIIYMESYGAIARGNKVEWYAAGLQVKQYAGSNKCVGTALDKTSATGQLVRVKVRSIDAYSSSSSSSSCRSSSSSSSSSI